MLSVASAGLVALLQLLQPGKGNPHGFVDIAPRSSDPCAAIAGQKWVSPAAVRACFTSFKVEPVIKANVRSDFSFYANRA